MFLWNAGNDLHDCKKSQPIRPHRRLTLISLFTSAIINFNLPTLHKFLTFLTAQLKFLKLNPLESNGNYMYHLLQLCILPTKFIYDSQNKHFLRLSFSFKGLVEVMPINVPNSKILPSILKQHSFMFLATYTIPLTFPRPLKAIKLQV
jgi:hypothetical protein